MAKLPSWLAMRELKVLSYWNLNDVDTVEGIVVEEA